ncbi:hypothetical protein HMPREF0496_0661 [Lentilactobacillus hilgardii ATCC 27305]|nr:hypothetical protein HMPREF0496_0661 [Lentilactobacillus hilgardii ATCC 27305]
MASLNQFKALLFVNYFITSRDFVQVDFRENGTLTGSQLSTRDNDYTKGPHES